jgi:G3E family GTPase
MEIPVYLFTGFLEAGKTKCIQETLEDYNFNTGEPLLVISCEEGVEELDPTSFASPNVAIEFVEEPGDLTTELMEALEKKHNPKMLYYLLYNFL